MKKLFGLLLLATLSLDGFSQIVTKTSTDSIPDAKDYLTTLPTPSSNDSERKINNELKEVPEYPGGSEALQKFLAVNIKYPKKAFRKNIQGRVVVQFVIEKDGSVSNVEVKKGIGGGCDEEAARVVGMMPKWKPGKLNGALVKVLYIVPVTFSISS